MNLQNNGVITQDFLLRSVKKCEAFSFLLKETGNVMIRWFNCSDGRVVRASAFGAVDLGLIPSRFKPMTLKLVFTASLLDAKH